MLPQIAPALQPAILNILLSTPSDDASVPTPSPSSSIPFSVQPTAQKGLGAIATRDLAIGDVILSDRPLCVWPQGLKRAEAEELFAGMTGLAKEVFRGLANAMPGGEGEEGEEMGEVLGIRATNGFNVELPGVEEETAVDAEPPTHASFIFPRIARINHSCLNNADHAMDWSNLIMTVYAITSIPSNSELTIEYTSGLIQLPRSSRLTLLQQTFGFHCSCPCCTLPAPEQQTSDARRVEIDEIVKRVAEGGMKRGEVLDAFERVRVLLEEEGYLAVPEFSEPGVSRAYAVYRGMHAQKMAVAEFDNPVLKM